jgi:hypothetical protein
MSLTKVSYAMVSSAAGSPFDYMTADQIADVQSYSYTLDVTEAVQAALDAHDEVYLPAGGYLISDTIKIKKDGQKMVGAGRSWVPTRGTHFLWAGVNTKDAIELDSERMDGASDSDVLVGAYAGNFGLSFKAGFAPRNALFVRDGVFHSTFEQIYARPYAGNPPAEAMLKLHSGEGYSYGVGNMFRDIAIRADMLTYTAGPVPKGVWVQSAIESVFENVRVFDCEDGWVIGDDDPNYRNVQNIQFYSCHSEIVGNRDNNTVAGCSLRYYAGTDIGFYGCKFNAGTIPSDSAWADHRHIRFVSSTAIAAGSADTKGLYFDGCYFWGTGTCDYSIEVSAAAKLQEVVFDKCQFVDLVQGIIETNTPATPQIALRDSSFYRALFNGSEIASFSGFGVDTGALSIAATTAQVHEADNLLPYTQNAFYIGSISSNNGQPIMVSAAQQTYGNYGIEFSLFNAGASTASTSADTVLRLRPLLDSEIVVQSQKTQAPGLITSGSVYSLAFSVPGVAFGDHVFAAFSTPKQTSSFELDGAILGAYVSAANTITFQIMNRRGAGFTPNSGATMFVCKAYPKFDIYQTTTYDAPSIANVSQLTHDVTVTGAAVGDYVSVSASASLQGLFVKGVVKAADTVTLYFYNATGGAIDLPSIDYGIGVIKQPLTA